ncbi:uncharacterized protein LOC142982194 [Anticarsia gemmatalis]|uniref:uncharacterized protein LOC142982194 n=1 Tax=Anticarsia gemmatalis TaxID=129554 RepID=UPI003F76B315
MVIEKLHGLQATSMSLNDRFTLLANVTQEVVPVRRTRRRNTLENLFAQTYNGDKFFEQVVRQAHQIAQQSRRAFKMRLGAPQPLRRFGSENNLPRLRRASSAGNLNQIHKRVGWRQSNGNLSRSASFNNLSTMRGNMRRRGAGQQRGRNRRGMVGMNYGSGPASRAQYRAFQRMRQRNGRGGARGRGNLNRNQQQQKPVTKEELDLQLDQYMAGSKAALDEELDNYMKNAMDLE